MSGDQPRWTHAELAEALGRFEADLRAHGLPAATAQHLATGAKRFVRWLSQAAPAPQGQADLAPTVRAPRRGSPGGRGFCEPGLSTAGRGTG